MEQILLMYVKAKCLVKYVANSKFDEYVNENKTVHNKNWPYIPDHPSQPARGVLGTSPEGPLKVLTSRTSRALRGPTKTLII